MVPFTKIKHVFTAMASLSMRDPQNLQRRLPMADLESDSKSATTGRSPTSGCKHLLLRSMPAQNAAAVMKHVRPMPAGYPLSPRDFVLSLRELAADSDPASRRRLPEPLTPLAALGDGINQIRPRNAVVLPDLRRLRGDLPGRN